MSTRKPVNSGTPSQRSPKTCWQLLVAANELTKGSDRDPTLGKFDLHPLGDRTWTSGLPEEPKR
ncbi:MAG: hypothetical protein KJO07_13825 [Deltaproteobacteria bacterium]|nr:hypothetical protein [Deltaproteobacteria bacterium]